MVVSVIKLLSQADSIRKTVESGSASLSRRNRRPVQFPTIEENVLKFLSMARSAKLPVRQDAIQLRALILRDEILKEELRERSF